MSFLARRAHAHTPLRVPRRAYATETHRPRPEPSKKWPVILAAVTGGVLAWSAFLTYITNQEKISSSVVRQIMRSVKESVELRDHLGEAIRPQPEWWLNGDPRIKGNINQLQGNVDTLEPCISQVSGKKKASPSPFSDLKSFVMTAQLFISARTPSSQLNV
ncbi:hypothetical protein PLEOSDRAFT_1099102 [Pleurotus ostreatus PC15]|uniref:Uncharacterized protein n=1 Tax=Pleurotus ostreatus (strain PC15) TaxID=1137138 RepID=A0A067P1K1_PLEO1|nr:hypothetical protein PLEOSDRAFT_1099102 [Pleurotus ostreatus PC15]